MRSVMAVVGIWIVPNLPVAKCSLKSLSNGNRDIQSTQYHQNKGIKKNHVDESVTLLLSVGVPQENLCTHHHEMVHLLPMCAKDSGSTNSTAKKPFLDRNSIVRSRRERYLQEEKSDLVGGEEEDVWFLLTHALC